MVPLAWSNTKIKCLPHITLQIPNYPQTQKSNRKNVPLSCVRKTKLRNIPSHL